MGNNTDLPVNTLKNRAAEDQNQLGVAWQLWWKLSVLD